MAAISLKAHYDGHPIQLDKPFPLIPKTKLIVTVLPDDQALTEWRADWYKLAAQGIARAYGDNEPEYTKADCIP